MLKRITLSLALLCMLAVSSQAQIRGVFDKAKKEAEKLVGGGSLSQEEAGNGLKEALNLGVSEAVDFLSAENGYLGSAYKILLPPEVEKVTTRLKAVPGFSNVEAELIEKMNRAAEIAAAKAKPIFISAIKQMTFKDALDILMGDKDAATRYLERTTGQALFAEFQPVIQASLDEVNAREYWRGAVTAYNRIPLVEKTNPELDEYVTQRALAGLFGLVEKKERNLRENPSLRTSELLQKVFSRQDK